MECKFTVGQKVVWVDASVSPRVLGTMYQNHPKCVHNLVIEGEVYTVRGIGVHPTTGNIGVLLDGFERVHPVHGDLPMRATRFRPVTTTQTDISVFTEIVRREFDVDKVVKPVKEIA